MSDFCSHILSPICNQALNPISEWCSLCGLNVNFRKPETICNFPISIEVQLSLSKIIKYMGIILDSKLSWKDNIIDWVREATIALPTCKDKYPKSGVRAKPYSTRHMLDGWYTDTNATADWWVTKALFDILNWLPSLVRLNAVKSWPNLGYRLDAILGRHRQTRIDMIPYNFLNRTLNSRISTRAQRWVTD